VQSQPLMTTAPGPPRDLQGWVRGLAMGAVGVQRPIWDAFASHVRRLLEQMLGPVAEVEDCTVEVFLRLFRRPVHVEHAAALPGFITAITMNVARTALRRRRLRRLVGLTATGEVPEVAAFDPDPTVRLAARRFLALLDRLGADERATYVLCSIEGMSYVEAAGALDLSVSTVRRRLGRAKGRVQKWAAREPWIVRYLEHTGRESGKGDR